MPLSTKQLDTLSDVIGEAIDDRFERHSTSFDPEKFGEAVGDSIIAALKPLKERIKQLEERTEGMQSKLDKCMSFSGEWQQALDYKPGALVRRGQELFVATRHIKSGAALAARDGSGWERI